MIIADEKKRSIGSVPLSHTGSDGSMKDGPEEEEGMEAFHAIASELIDAVEMKDPKGVAEALHAFYQECEMLHEGEENEGEEKEGY